MQSREIHARRDVSVSNHHYDWFSKYYVYARTIYVGGALKFGSQSCKVNNDNDLKQTNPRWKSVCRHGSTIDKIMNRACCTWRRDSRCPLTKAIMTLQWYLLGTPVNCNVISIAPKIRRYSKTITTLRILWLTWNIHIFHFNKTSKNITSFVL